MNNTIGEKIRALRKSRGYSQEGFARVLDTNQANVSAWERGERRPTDAALQHIANTFNVPVYSLLPFQTDDNYDDLVKEIADAFRREPKMRLLFDKTRYMSDDDIDVVLSVVGAISKERSYHE